MRVHHEQIERPADDAVVAALLAGGARLVAITAGAARVRWRTREAAGAVEVPQVAVRDTRVPATCCMARSPSPWRGE